MMKAKMEVLLTEAPNSELEPLKTFFKRDFLISAAFIPLFF
jgi:hypothetical protein